MSNRGGRRSLGSSFFKLEVGDDVVEEQLDDVVLRRALGCLQWRNLGGSSMVERGGRKRVEKGKWGGERAEGGAQLV
nr:unnamed protein product [Digitaria exilis]